MRAGGLLSPSMDAQQHELEPPQEAWMLGWVCLAAEFAILLEHGAQSSESIPLSIILGALVIGWFSYGVLCARMIRTFIVWVLFILALVIDLVDVVDHATGWAVANTAFSALQLYCLHRFTSTDYFHERRRDPRRAYASVAGIVALGVCVGILGGVVGTESSDLRVQVNF